MGAFLQDLRYGVRMLLKHPGLAGVSILAFGLGIGLTTTMWSINYGALLRGLPFADPGSIMSVARTNPERDIDRTGYATILDYDLMRERQTSFTQLAGWTAGTINVSGAEGGPVRYRGGFVTAGAFPVLGERPLLGRWFTVEEETWGGPLAVILGYDIWRNRFAGDRAIVGRGIRVNGEPATVVGVMPEGFRFQVSDELWVPLRVNRATERRDAGSYLNVFGRLKPGVTPERAQEEFAALEGALAREFPETNRGIRPLIEPYTRAFIGDEPTLMLWTMMGAVLGVLLIACSNVANLLLARAAVRTREIAVRTALGARRWRIVSQLLAESLVLALAGAALGIVIALVGVRLFNQAIADTDPPFWIVIAVDGPVLLFVLGATALAAAVSGVLPALQATGTRINEVLKDESRGASSLRLDRFSKGLVVAEIALSCGLLIGAGFMIESVVRRSRFDYGVPTARVFSARIGLFEAAQPDSAARQRFWRQVLQRLESQPGHEGVALATGLPGLGTGTNVFTVEGREYPTERDYPRARVTAVTPGFFRAFRLAPVEGRVFGDRIPEGVLVPAFQGDYRFMSVAIAAAGGDPMRFADVVRREVAGVLLLATIGVYGVMSFAVSRRTQEVGVRMALGAGGGTVLAMFLRQGAWQVGAGATLGLGLAFLLSRGIQAVLFQVDTANPLMFAGVVTALAATAMVAILIPARRAMRVDPVVALRYD